MAIFFILQLIITMICFERRNNPTFLSKFPPSRTTKEVDEFAKNFGYDNFTKTLNRELKPHKNYSFNVKHNYSKTYKLSKTEIKYERNGIPYKIVETDSKITNPAELTFKIMMKLKDINSTLFKDIFR